MIENERLKLTIKGELGVEEIRVSSEDEMYSYLKKFYCDELALVHYLNSGRHMFDVAREIIGKLFGGNPKEMTFLEFACGHGRFTRYLYNWLPKQNVWVADIYDDAIKFQEHVFGSQTILSAADPRKVQFPIKYDIIFVSSLFSHLPAERFREWAFKLYNQLTDSGILIFSTHGMKLLGKKRGEYKYVKASESCSLSPEEYGTTYVSSNYVTKILKKIDANLSIKLFETLLWENQDVCS